MAHDYFDESRSFGNLTVRIAVYFTPSFAGKCGEVGLQNVILAIAKTTQLTYATKEWQGATNIRFVIVLVEQWEELTNFHAGHVLTKFTRLQAQRLLGREQ